MTVVLLRSSGLEPDQLSAILLANGIDADVRMARLADAVAGAPEIDVAVIGDHETSLSIAFLGEQTRQIFPEVAMLAVTWRPASENARAAVTAGVDGIVLGSEIERTLAPAIAAIHAGQLCVPRIMWNMSSPSVLSSRQQETLRLAIGGLTNAEIAERLNLSPATVTTHLHFAFRRLGVHSRREAAKTLA